MRAVFYLRSALELIAGRPRPLPQWWQELVQQYEDDDEAKRVLEEFRKTQPIYGSRLAKVFRGYRDTIDTCLQTYGEGRGDIPGWRVLLELAAGDPSTDKKYFEWMVRLFEDAFSRGRNTASETVKDVIEAVKKYDQWKKVIEVVEADPEAKYYLYYFPTLARLQLAIEKAEQEGFQPRLLQRNVKRELIYPSRPSREQLKNARVYRVRDYDSLCAMAPDVAWCHDDTEAWSRILGDANNSVWMIKSNDNVYPPYLAIVNTPDDSIRAIYDSNNLLVHPNEDIYQYIVEVLNRAGIGRGDLAQDTSPRRLKVYRIDNHEALCSIGGDTRWCSAIWSAPNYWLQNGRMFNGNIVYVVVDYDNRHKYIVRVGRNDGGIKVIRNENDVPIELGSETYLEIVSFFEQLRIAKRDDQDYQPSAGGNWYIDEHQELGRFRAYGDIIGAFGFTAQQWNATIKNLQDEKGIKIVPSDFVRLVRTVLPRCGSKLADMVAGNSYIIKFIEAYDDGAGGAEKREALIRLLTEYARDRSVNKLMGILRQINERLGGQRMEESRTALLAHVLSGQDIDDIVETELFQDPSRYLDSRIALYSVLRRESLDYVREHYTELSKWVRDRRIRNCNRILRPFTDQSIGELPSSPELSEAVGMLAVAEWAHVLQWPERGVEDPDKELSRWVQLHVYNPAQARVAGDAMAFLQQMDETDSGNRAERMRQMLLQVDLGSRDTVLHRISHLETSYDDAARVAGLIFLDEQLVEFVSVIMSDIKDNGVLMRVLNEIEDIYKVLQECGWAGHYSRYTDRSYLIQFCTQSASPLSDMIQKILYYIPLACAADHWTGEIAHIRPIIDRVCACMRREGLSCTPDILVDMLQQFGGIGSEEDIWRFCAWLSRDARGQAKVGSRWAALWAAVEVMT